MIYYLRCDGNGTDSIADVLGHKDLTTIAITNYGVFNDWALKNVTKLTNKDTVIVDTIDMLASMTRIDLKLGTTDPLLDLWAARPKLMTENKHGSVYTDAKDLIMRHLKNFNRSGEGAKIITTAHEAERVDETTIPPSKKRSPDLNAEFLGSLIGSSSDVFRLTRLDEPVIDDKGEIILAADTRILQLKATDEYVAKCQVPFSRVPQIKRALANPTYPILCEHLGKVPTWLTVYGPSGVGKSTFATSMLRTS